MTRSRFLGLALAFVLSLVSVSRAQEPTPTITVVMSSQKALLDNLQSIMVGMAQSPNEYATLKDTIEVFLLGTEPTRALSYRGYLVGKDLRDVYTVPVTDTRKLKDFLTNLSDIGFTTRRDPAAGRGEELYRMTKMDTGSIRFDPRTQAAHIVPLGDTKDSSQQAMSRTLAKAITTPAPHTLLGNRDLLILVENTAAKTAERNAAFDKVMANVNSAVEKKLQNESAAEHALRVAAAKQQMAELERFFVEGSRIVIGSTTAVKQGTSQLDVELKALPETELARSVALLGKSPDTFGGISSEGALTFSNINFPVDDLRKKHLQEIAKLWLPALNERIDARGDLSADAKQAEKDLAELSTQVMNEIAELGIFNGFMRVYKKDTEYTTVGAARVPDGNKFLDLLKKMEGHKGAVVKLEMDKAGDKPGEDAGGNGGAAPESAVAIHSIHLPHAAKDFPGFFDNDGALFIGTSSESIWYAHGQEGLNALKQAIQEASAAGPKTSPLLVNSSIALLPWLEAWDLRQGKKAGIGVRKAAIEGLKAGKDLFTAKLWLDEKDPETVRLQVIGYDGILRAAGKIAAKVVRDKLE